MSKTSKHGRHDPLSLPSSLPRSEPGRGTFTASRARAVLADTIPDVVYARPSSRPKLTAEPVKAAASSERLDAPARSLKRDNRLSLQDTRPSLSVRNLEPDTCRKRPTDNEPKGGSGSGPRRFIPWGCK